MRICKSPVGSGLYVRLEIFDSVNPNLYFSIPTVKSRRSPSQHGNWENWCRGGQWPPGRMLRERVGLTGGSEPTHHPFSFFKKPKIPNFLRYFSLSFFRWRRLRRNSQKTGRVSSIPNKRIFVRYLLCKPNKLSFTILDCIHGYSLYTQDRLGKVKSG